MDEVPDGVADEVPKYIRHSSAMTCLHSFEPFEAAKQQPKTSSASSQAAKQQQQTGGSSNRQAAAAAAARQQPGSSQAAAAGFKAHKPRLQSTHRYHFLYLK